MPPKFDPKIKVIYLWCIGGGEVCNTSVLVRKIRPLDLSPKKAGDDITKATGGLKFLGITVKLNIQNTQAQLEVVPSTSALIIRAPTRNHLEIEAKHIKHSANVTFDELVIA
uniref:60S ribosomal protein L12-like n=1 Tax=Nyctereutes procyonoides TaxID=34880 RepID=UPI00244516C1|nr:60S ribosomal protein L12-like [Nyctereutes procyonoides]